MARWAPILLVSLLAAGCGSDDGASEASSSAVTGQSSAGTPTTGAPPAETPPSESPPAETPPTESPPAETPPTESPPAETPPTESPPAETPPTDPAVSTLTIASEPPGANVEIGIQTVETVVTSGTGRMVGTTPVTVELSDGDIVDDSPTIGCCQLYAEVTLDGCVPALLTIAVASDVASQGLQLEEFIDLDC